MSLQTEFIKGFKVGLLDSGFSNERADLFSGFALAVANLESGNFKGSKQVDSNNFINYGYVKSKLQIGFIPVKDDVGKIGKYANAYDNGLEFAKWICRGDRKLTFIKVDDLSKFISSMKLNGFMTEDLNLYYKNALSLYKGSSSGKEPNKVYSKVIGCVGKLSSFFF